MIPVETRFSFDLSMYILTHFVYNENIPWFEVKL